MSTIELKPCPFCGGEATLVAPGFSNSGVLCGENYCGQAVSVNVWNTRATDREALASMEEIARLRAELDAAEAMAEAAADIVECMDDAGLSGANLDLVPLRNALHRFKREAPATDAAEAKMGEPVAWRYRYNKNWNIANIGLEWSPWKLMAHEPSALDAEFEIEPLYLYAAPPAAEPVKVKPLEWSFYNEEGVAFWRAKKPFGSSYHIEEMEDGGFGWLATHYHSLEDA